MAKKSGNRGRYVRDANGRFARTGSTSSGSTKSARKKVSVPRNFKVNKANPIAVGIAARTGHAKSRKATTTAKAPKQSPPKATKSLNAEEFKARLFRDTVRARRKFHMSRANDNNPASIVYRSANAKRR